MGHYSIVGLEKCFESRSSLPGAEGRRQVQTRILLLDALSKLYLWAQSVLQFGRANGQLSFRSASLRWFVRYRSQVIPTSSPTRFVEFCVYRVAAAGGRTSPLGGLGLLLPPLLFAVEWGLPRALHRRERMGPRTVRRTCRP